MSLIQPLPDGALDIVGDIHGEHEALCALLQHLGYSEAGMHPEARALVFVGDFCDRGPDSPAVLTLVESLVRSGRACAVLGNHEINLLQSDAKDGSGWFFGQRYQSDLGRYAPFQCMDEGRKAAVLDFLSGLPIGLERKDLRVVHAAWIDEHIETARSLPAGSVVSHYREWDALARQRARALLPLMQEEILRWPYPLEDRDAAPPFLDAHAEFESVRQMMNPLRVLTSGVERKGAEPFYSSGKWRFAERVQWWNEYADTVPVVVGHYWRRISPINRSALGKGDPDLFAGVNPAAWHGLRRNVLCVDFSVGGRWTARRGGAAPLSEFKLGALRWPEGVLMFDDGQTLATEGPGVRP